MSDKKVDQEWKKRAREEKEKLRQEDADGASAVSAPDASLPLIISSFVAQALIAMGEMESPVDGKRHVDLEGAKFSIDLIQVLEDKTKGNLAPDEVKMLQNALYDLRMRYVQLSG